MAILYPLTMPTFTKPQSLFDHNKATGFRDSRIGIKNRQIINVARDGTTHVAEQPGSRWHGGYSLPPLARDEAMQWQMFLERLQGRFGTFYAFDDTYDEARKFSRGLLATSIPFRGQIVFTKLRGWDYYFAGEPIVFDRYGDLPVRTDLSSYLGFLTSNRMPCRNGVNLTAYIYGDVAQPTLVFFIERAGGSIQPDPEDTKSFTGLPENSDGSKGPINFHIDDGDQFEFRLQAGNDTSSAYDAAEVSNLTIGISNLFNIQDADLNTLQSLKNNNYKSIDITGQNNLLGFNFRVGDTDFDDWVEYFEDNLEMILYVKTGSNQAENHVWIKVSLDGLYGSDDWSIVNNMQAADDTGNCFCEMPTDTYVNLVFRKTGDREITIYALESAGWQSTAQLVDIYANTNYGEPDNQLHLVQRLFVDIQQTFNPDREFDSNEFLARVNPASLNTRITPNTIDLQEGDQFNIGDTMHKVVQIEDDGDLTVDFVPKLDAIPSSIPDITFDNPRCIARLADSQTNIIEDTNQRKVINFDWEQS